MSGEFLTNPNTPNHSLRFRHRPAIKLATFALLRISKRGNPKNTERRNLERTLETLGDIPLAIELVGGYIAEHEVVSFERYYQYLSDVPLDRLEQEFPEGSFTAHDRSIIKTLRISEKTIYEKPLMVEILKILAWSGSSSMGTSLLQALANIDDDFDFRTALGDADKLRLLRKDEAVERFAIHRLLAKVIRHENPLAKEVAWVQEIIGRLAEWFYERGKGFEYLEEFESEIEHLDEWQGHAFEHIPNYSHIYREIWK